MSDEPTGPESGTEIDPQAPTAETSAEQASTAVTFSPEAQVRTPSAEVKATVEAQIK